MKIGRHFSGATLHNHRRLTQAGFILVRVSGSHAMYSHPDGRRFLAVTNQKAKRGWMMRKIDHAVRGG